VQHIFLTKGKFLTLYFVFGDSHPCLPFFYFVGAVGDDLSPTDFARRRWNVLPLFSFKNLKKPPRPPRKTNATPVTPKNIWDKKPVQPSV
jgi:hypothetical protein